MDVAVWLRRLGLGKYEAAFRENEIDETVLPAQPKSTSSSLASRHSGIGWACSINSCLRNDAGRKAIALDAAASSSAPSAHLEDQRSAAKSR